MAATFRLSRALSTTSYAQDAFGTAALERLEVDVFDDRAGLSMDHGRTVDDELLDGGPVKAPRESRRSPCGPILDTDEVGLPDPLAYNRPVHDKGSQ